MSYNAAFYTPSLTVIKGWTFGLEQLSLQLGQAQYLKNKHNHTQYGTLSCIFQHPPSTQYSKQVNHSKFFHKILVLRNVQTLGKDISNLISTIKVYAKNNQKSNFFQTFFKIPTLVSFIE